MIRNLKLLSLGVLLIITSACSIFPRNNEPIGDDQSVLVARDLSGALSLLRGYSPRNTTLQLRPAKTRFGRSLEQALRARGYGIQGIPVNDTGPMLVSYEVEAFENSAGQSVGYRLRAGAVELAREYEIRGGRVFPMTGLSVKGVEIARQPLDQSIFDRNRAASEEQEKQDRQSDGLLLPNRHPLSNDNSAASELTQRTKSLRERVFGVADRYKLVEAMPTRIDQVARQLSDEQATAPVTGALQKKRNVLELGRSNYASVTQDYDVLSADVLVFGNDSLWLGSDNKEILADMANQFDPETDVISLIGCSHGPSANPNGNEHLAVGRANRVKEELILANISAENILDEVCWATTAQDALPARGVIVRMLRRTTEG